MDACHRFPQYVLVVIPLKGVHRCSSWCLVVGFSAVVAHDCSWNPAGLSWWLETTPKVQGWSWLTVGPEA